MKCLSAIALVILGGLLQLASVKAEEPLQSVRYGTWGFDISGENAAIKPGDAETIHRDRNCFGVPRFWSLIKRDGNA